MASIGLLSGTPPGSTNTTSSPHLHGISSTLPTVLC